MRIEKLSKGKSRKIILFILILLFIIGIIYITNSKAKYRVTKNVQIVNGNVNYSLADFNLMAIYLQNKEGDEGIPGSYSKSSTGIVPSTGYSLRPLGNNANDSYCMVDNVKNNTGITITQEGDGVNFTGIKKQGTKCYLYFDVDSKPNSQKVLESVLGLTSNGPLTEGFSGPSCDSTDSNTGCGTHNMNQNGIYESTDDDGTTYYFRGAVTNNYVKFGKTGNVKNSGSDMYWRIIRINGDGSIRMIYEGTTANANGDKNNTDSVVATSQKWNIQDQSVYDDNKYVGLTWSDGQVRGYTTKSNVLTQLETWYTNNLADEADSIDKDAGFCNDRQPSSSTTEIDNKGGTLKTTTYYGAYTRIVGPGSSAGSSKQKPTFKCSAKTSNYSNDLYTVSGASKGNKQLTSPIGLITADEVSFAGGYYGANNYKYYLFNGQNYWTMSPFGFGSGSARVFIVNSYGFLGNVSVSNTYGVRPVINLSAKTKFTNPGTGAKGSKDNPYTVS